jgi:hypothetical protein
MKPTLLRLGNGPAVCFTTFVSLFMLIFLLAACDRNEPKVTFQNPKDGETVASPLFIIMQAENFTVEPAGDVRDGAGHLHIMIDVPCIEPGEVIPKDDNHRHFGDGSTEANLELTPGEHNLCLQAADGAHIALPGEGTTHLVTLLVQ